MVWLLHFVSIVRSYMYKNRPIACERVEAIVHKIANHSRENKKNAEKDQFITQLLSFSPTDCEKVYPKMCMNRIMLIIEYMNAIYALKNWIIIFILQLAHFVYEYSVVITLYICYTIFVCWCPGRVIQRCFALYSGSLLKGLIMQARIQDFMLEDTLHRRTFIINIIFFCFLFF